MNGRELLLIYYLGGSFIIFLAWVAAVGELLIGTRRMRARTAVWIFVGLGFAHPASAASAWDLVRLSNDNEVDSLEVPGWLPATSVLGGAVSTMAALALFLTIE